MIGLLSAHKSGLRSDSNECVKLGKDFYSVKRCSADIDCFNLASGQLLLKQTDCDRFQIHHEVYVPMRLSSDNSRNLEITCFRIGRIFEGKLLTEAGAH